MPSIVEKKIAWDLPQIDGTRNVREVHVDDSGIEHIVDYNTSLDDDIQENLNTRIIIFPAVETPEQKKAALLAQLAALGGA